MPNIGIMELLIVLVVAVLILGPKRIPAAAKSVGQGVRSFRSSLGGKDDDSTERETAKIDEKTKTGA